MKNLAATGILLFMTFSSFAQSTTNVFNYSKREITQRFGGAKPLCVTDPRLLCIAIRWEARATPYGPTAPEKIRKLVRAQQVCKNIRLSPFDGAVKPQLNQQDYLVNMDEDLFEQARTFYISNKDQYVDSIRCDYTQLHNSVYYDRSTGSITF